MMEDDGFVDVELDLSDDVLNALSQHADNQGVAIEQLIATILSDYVNSVAL